MNHQMYLSKEEVYRSYTWYMCRMLSLATWMWQLFKHASIFFWINTCKKAWFFYCSLKDKMKYCVVLQTLFSYNLIFVYNAKWFVVFVSIKALHLDAVFASYHWIPSEYSFFRFSLSWQWAHGGSHRWAGDA